MPPINVTKKTIWVKNKKARFNPSSTSRLTNELKLARLMSGNEERKYLDNYNNDATGATTSGTLVGLNSIAEGTDFNQRIGRKVRAKYLEYDVAFTPGSTQVLTANYTWAIVLDRQPNNALPTYANVFDTSVITTKPFTFKNVAQFQERFKIIKQVVGQVQVGSSGFATGNECRCKGYLPLISTQGKKDDIIHWSGSGSGVPNTNNYVFIYSSDLGTGANISPIIIAGIRLVYNDM